MSLWYHYWAMNARGNVVRSWGAPLKFESRDEQLGIRLGDWETSDIRHLTSILQPSGIALYKNRCSGAFINRRLEMFLPTLFHTASALSAPLGHLPLEGKADDTRKTCDQQTFGHRPINICGEAATDLPSPCGEGLGGATLRVDFCKLLGPHSARWSLSLVTSHHFL